MQGPSYLVSLGKVQTFHEYVSKTRLLVYNSLGDSDNLFVHLYLSFCLPTLSVLLSSFCFLSVGSRSLVFIFYILRPNSVHRNGIGVPNETAKEKLLFYVKTFEP